MKNYEEMANNVFRRRDEYNAEQAKKRRIVRRVTVPLAGGCLAVLLGVGLWQGGRGHSTAPAISGGTESSGEHPNPTSKHTESSSPLQIPDGAVWGASPTEGTESVDSLLAAITWNGLECHPSLYDALTNSHNPETVFAVAVSKPGESRIPDSFTVSGKSYAEWNTEYGRLSLLNAKFAGLYKEGDDLKYGEDLCITGNAEGIRWAREHYEERVAFYGVDFLAKYLVNGEFLIEKLARDARTASADLLKAETDLRAAQNEYRRSLAEKNRDYFQSMGVYAIVYNHQLCLFVTADELAAIPPNTASGYYFSLACQETVSDLADRTAEY